MIWSCHGGGAGAPGGPPPITTVLFISHTKVSPVMGMFQRMSLVPSPLKSPVSAICQGGGGVKAGTAPKITDVPSLPMSQISVCRVVLLNQTMSVLPSPLKSPVPATVQSRGGVPGTPLPIIGQSFAVHLSNQISACPVWLLYQRKSANPSPLKSPVPLISQSSVTVGGEAAPI